MNGALTSPRTEFRFGLLLLGILAFVYGLLYAGHWVPGSDQEYYLAVARNMLLGRGFAFNDSAVRLVPPLWPLALSAAMRVSASFAFLNMLPVGLSLVAALLWYRILARVMPPGRRCVAVVLSMTFYWSYQSASTLLSESLFCPLFAGAMLLAIRTSEDRSRRWELAMLPLLCTAMVLTRWAGIVAMIIVVAAMIGDMSRLRQVRRWLMPVLIVALAAGAFLMARQLMRLGASSEQLQELAPEGGPGAILMRLALGGQWVCSLMFMPAELAVSSHAIAIVVNIIGWILIGLYVIAIFKSAGGRRAMWIAVLVYCALLWIQWLTPNSRYLVPVAPVLLAGVWLGIEKSAALVTGVLARRALAVASLALIIAIAACNAAMLAVDIRIVHSNSFYATHLAGQAEGLLSAVEYLESRSLADGEVAVNARYINLDRTRPNGFAIRGLNLLTNRTIRVVPEDVCGGEPDESLTRWAKENGVRYYLYRPPVSPWRVWHFRWPALQTMVTGRPAAELPMWKLYEVADGRAMSVPLPPGRQPVNRVPGVP